MPARLISLLAVAAALVVPPAASALTFQIANESGRPPENVFVTVAGAPGEYEVPGMTNNVPVPLSTIPNQMLKIDKLVSGRIYISYGAGVTTSVPFTSATRFDWAELTVTPSSSDVANLTAVDQFGIGMRLDTFSTSEEHLETVGDANSNTIFNALQQIPGGPEATMRDGNGNILRVLSPNKSTVYPDLGEYVRSMNGQTIHLTTAFFGPTFSTTSYGGTFDADGSIELRGITNPAGAAPASILVDGNELIGDIYTGGNTPNNAEGAIYRDLLAGFSTGLWGGRYGDSALSFCTNPITNAQGSFCPEGFNQPAFGDARASLSPFPTCEQYAAVINQYTDVYGNPYSDASKKVTVSIDQPGSGGNVGALRLTILPDSGNAQPAAGGNSNCGAAPAVPSTPPAPRPTTSVNVKLFKQAKLKGTIAKVARVSCSSACGRIQSVAKRGRKVLAGETLASTGATQVLKVRLTKAAMKLFKHRPQANVRLSLEITPAGQGAVRQEGSLKLIKAPAKAKKGVSS